MQFTIHKIKLQMTTSRMGDNRELRQQRWQWEMMTNFCDYCLFLSSFIDDRARCKWTGRSAVKVNIENERFTVVCSCYRWNIEFGNFRSSFDRLSNQIKSNQVKSSCLTSITWEVVTQSPEPEAHVLCVQALRVELEFRSAGFWGGGKPEYPGENLTMSKNCTKAYAACAAQCSLSNHCFLASSSPLRSSLL